MAKIPTKLNKHIDSAYPEHVCTMGTVLPDGYVQITPRGSILVYDEERLALWERGKGTSNASLADGTKVTVYFRNPALREDGTLKNGGIARFYGTAKQYKSGEIYDEVWDRIIPVEKERDPEKKGYAVIIDVERAEDLFGNPLEE